MNTHMITDSSYSSVFPACSRSPAAFTYTDLADAGKPQIHYVGCPDLPADVVTLDVETTINKDKESAPWRVDCKLHMVGILANDSPSYDQIVEEGRLVIGHNLAFDLSWFSSVPRSIWDTQLAAYILSGQLEMYASLDRLCVKYGLPVKDATISEAFAAGIGADKVDQTKLRTYLRYDLINTYAISVLQMREAEDKGLTPLILSQMDALRATIYMHKTGMAFSGAKCTTYMGRLQHTCAELHAKLQHEGLDLTNPHELATYLYGGVHKRETRREVGVYKSGVKMGQKRYAVEREDVTFSGFPFVCMRPGAEKRSVDEAHLQHIINHVPISTGTRYKLDNVLLYRDKSKQLNTYFIGHAKMVGVDGLIHPHFSHVGTRTGRLASNKPNIMNVTSGADIRKCYESRWGDCGYLVEIDYNQLEVAVLAHLSGDPTLLDDIRAGVDIHTALYEELHHRTPSKEDRKQIKRMVFALVYGGGANAMATQAGVIKAEAERVRDAFYERYKGVRTYHNKQLSAAERNVIGPEYKTEKGYPGGWYMDVSETGRRYMHREYDSKFNRRPGALEFSYTELLNYKVQGTATGDIVPMMLGHVFRVLEEKDLLARCKPVATIHDSIVFDVWEESATDVIHLLVETLTDVQRVYKGTFGVEFGPKLSVGVSKGRDWFNMEELKL